MATSRLSMAAPQVAASRLSMGMPRGVDLNLDQFNLSTTAEAGSWAGTLAAPEGAEVLAVPSEAFWSALKDVSKTVFEPEDKILLKSVFNPHLSDRRKEGKAFVPPPTGLSYMHKLKVLVEEEADVQRQRREHFVSTEFDTESAGPLFPTSWASSVKLEHEGRGQFSLQPRPDFKAQEVMLKEVLKSAVPEFDKQTEDGMRFLIYRVGSLEVRATQTHGANIVIEAVFCSGDDSGELQKGVIPEDEQIVKATHYVEKAKSGRLRCQYYVIFETQNKHTVITERSRDGSISWRENPHDLEERNAMARALGSADCNCYVNVGMLRGNLASTSRSCKQYARSAFRQVGQGKSCEMVPALS